MRIFLFIGLLFVLASTIDSFLHAAGVSFSLDLVKPFCQRRGFIINEVKWTKGAIFTIGSLSVLMGFLGRNLPLTAYGYYQAVVAMSTITLPLIVGIMGLKTNKLSFFTFSISLIFTWGLLTYCTKLDRYIIFFISMTVATLVYFISHYIFNKGFATVHRTANTTRHSLHTPSGKGFARTLTSWLVAPASWPKSAQKKVYDYGSEPFLFSLFFVCIPPLILLNTIQSYSAIYIPFIAYTIGIILVTGLMLKINWPGSLRSYFDLYWFMTLTYCLPFFGGLLFMVNPQSTSAMLGFCLYLLIFMICVDWQTFITLSSLGITASLIVYRVLSGHFWPVVEFNMGWNFAITLVTVVITGFFFSRKKELYNFSQVKKAKLYAGSIAHETNNYLNISMFVGDMIKRAVSTQKIAPLEEGQNTYTIPKELAQILINIGPQLSDGARQSTSKIEMFMSALKENILSAKSERVSVKACIEEALKDTYFQDIEVKKGLLLELDDDFKAQLAKAYFKHIVYNLVKNAYHHGGASQVKIMLDKPGRKLIVRDNGQGISSEKLPYIFDLFYSGGASSGIGLALVKLIVESLGATLHMSSQQGEDSFTAFTLIFPEVGHAKD